MFLPFALFYFFTEQLQLGSKNYKLAIGHYSTTF